MCVFCIMKKEQSKFKMFAPKKYNEKIDLKIYENKKMVHAILYGNSFYERHPSMFKMCVLCNNKIINHVYQCCSDCKGKICNECSQKISKNISFTASYKFCDCYLFKKEFDCNKLLCSYCSFTVQSINVHHGFDSKAFTSSFANTSYSYKCFYDLLKLIFFNRFIDIGQSNAIVRIINDFDERRTIRRRNKLTLGIEDYMKSYQYTQLFSIVMFELAKNDLITNYNVKK